MEYHDILDIWNKPQNSEAPKLTLDQVRLKEISTNKIKSGLSEIKGTAIFHWVVGIFWALFLISFMSHHIHELKFLLSAFVLFAITIFGFIIDGYKLQQYFSIHAYAPIMETQKRLEKIRFLETVDNLSLLVVIPLFSAPFTIVMAKWLMNIDLFMAWKHLASFTIGSAIIGTIITVLLIIFPDKNLNKSISFLKELKELNK